MNAAGLILLTDARERLPAGPNGEKPTLRWISTEARRLHCYRQMGKHAFIIEAAWQYFIEGRPWPFASAGASTKPKTEPSPSMRGSKRQRAPKAAPLSYDPLREALALSQGGRAR
jgi:hypothetical protein